MKVVQVIPDLDAGGAERTTLDVSNALIADGHGSLVISTGGRLVPELMTGGGIFQAQPVDTKNPITMWKNVQSIARTTSEFGGQLIHARSRAPAWSAHFAAKKQGIPFVTTYHGTYNSASFLKTKYNSIMAAGDLVIANSEFIARHIQKNHHLDPNRIRVIPRGIEMSAFDPANFKPDRRADMVQSLLLNQDVPVIVMPGRLTRWKGQLMMLDALHLLNQMGVQAQLILPGDAQNRDLYTQELNTKINTLGLDEQVFVPGHISDMGALYALADLVVSASIEPEAFGRVAVEGQAAGKPVIATAHGGSLETVQPGIGGFLVPPGDVKSMALAMAELLRLSVQSRKEWGQRGQTWVKKTFSLETMCRSTLDVYDELLR